jgi:DNA polymerase-1
MDALQLVSPKTRVLTSRRGFSDTVMYDLDGVRERYGFDPRAIPDFKALRGDTSDNIPGVPGIGDKTASKLIQQFGTIEHLFEHLDEAPAKQKAAIEPLHDQIVMAKELATIVRQVPGITLDLTRAQLGDFDRQRVVGLFHELGFRRMLDDIARSMGDRPVDGAGASGQLAMFAEAAAEDVAGGQDAPAAGSTQEGDGIVRSLDVLDEVVAKLRTAEAIAFNVQTTGVQPMRAEMVGIGLATGPDASWYVPVGHTDDEPIEQLAWDDVRARLTPILQDPKIQKWAHNAKFHQIVLARHGIETEGLSFDSMIAAYLLESNQRAFALRDLAWSKLQVEMPAGSTLLGSGRS